MARLVLLRKGNESLDQPGSYKPICLLDHVGKLFESIILGRLQQAIDGSSGLMDVLRKSRPTVNAVEAIFRQIVAVRIGTRKTERFMVLVTLDVKNAFNSTRWELIMKDLAKRKVPLCLLNIVASNFSDRKFEIKEKLW